MKKKEKISTNKIRKIRKEEKEKKREETKLFLTRNRSKGSYRAK